MCEKHKDDWDGKRDEHVPRVEDEMDMYLEWKDK